MFLHEPLLLVLQIVEVNFQLLRVARCTSHSVFYHLAQVLDELLLRDYALSARLHSAQLIAQPLKVKVLLLYRLLRFNSFFLHETHFLQVLLDL